MLDVAAAMFARDGYHGTSMRGLGERAGVNAASLYHYFRSKQEALFEVCRAGAGQSARRIEQAMAEHGSMQARLGAILFGHVGDLAAFSDYRHVFFDQRGHLSAGQLAEIDEISAGVRKMLRTLFEEARAAGELHPDVAARNAALTIAATLRALTQFYVDGPPRDFEGVARALIGTVMRGLAAA